ncbi:MAG TPA: hypothetical protein VF193_07510 [Steroidobacter sp.]
MPISQQLYSPGNAFIQGRAARQQQDYAQTRNQLAQMEAANAPREIAARNRLLDLQAQSAERQLSTEQAKTVYATLQQALDSGRPREFILQQVPDLAKELAARNIDLASMDDESVMQLVDGLARKYAGEAGITPPVQLETIPIEGGGILQRDPTTGALKEIVRPRAPEKPQTERPSFRLLTPEEVQQAGLPAGTSAQMDMSTGKVDVLSKRDNTGVLSQKDATTARQKLTMIQVAKKQIADIRKAFEEGTKGLNAFGPVQGLLPTQQGKKFDAAVDRMRSTLTALTRVPGVGAMSDYETRLDQAKFPKRTAYESVTEEQIQGIEDLLQTLESGYRGLLSGGAAQPQEQQEPQRGPPRITSDAEYDALPSGTVFIAPDGSQRRKP